MKESEVIQFLISYNCHLCFIFYFSAFNTIEKNTSDNELTEVVTKPREKEEKDSVGVTSQNTNVQTGAGKITGFV